MAEGRYAGTHQERNYIRVPTRILDPSPIAVFPQLSRVWERRYVWSIEWDFRAKCHPSGQQWTLRVAPRICPVS
jgi:hypothetical protein